MPPPRGGKSRPRAHGHRPRHAGAQGPRVGPRPPVERALARRAVHAGGLGDPRARRGLRPRRRLDRSVRSGEPQLAPTPPARAPAPPSVHGRGRRVRRARPLLLPRHRARERRRTLVPARHLRRRPRRDRSRGAPSPRSRCTPTRPTCSATSSPGRSSRPLCSAASGRAAPRSPWSPRARSGTSRTRSGTRAWGSTTPRSAPPPRCSARSGCSPPRS